MIAWNFQDGSLHRSSSIRSRSPLGRQVVQANCSHLPLLRHPHDPVQIPPQVHLHRARAGCGNINDHFETLKTFPQLDGAQAGTNLSGLKPDEDEKDFFETAAECPITPNTEAPLHR